MPVSNTVLITERDNRSVEDSSLLVGNNFMMAASHHPLIKQLKSGLFQNVSALNEGPNGGLPTAYTNPTMYGTGPFYINLRLGSVFDIDPSRTRKSTAY